MTIKTLFDSNKQIQRTIEKVITYGASQEERLKSEISEYIVTDSIEEQFQKLLTKMQAAMEDGGENEVGVWVSGFYGSGKSSFTKYLGIAFDNSVTIAGTPFLQHLQDRLKKSTTKALLSSVAKKFPAAVVMLDLASEQVAGASMEAVSTVLYYKVLQWAGYSRNLKVAAFERRVKKEGRHDEFLKIFQDQTDGESWSDYRNDELVVDSIIPVIAHQMYPSLFKTETSFNTETSDINLLENERVEEMLNIAREHSGKDYIIFIIDEVGQYVGSRNELILNLDGLAKNLKGIGNGKAWIIGTAQQTLTEDDPKATLNSPELYKLKDRFPIQIDLEAHDIKEICYSRLLGKSPKGESDLGALFEQYGPSLRHSTKLENEKFYGADFKKESFCNLYPFLPAHFDILLHLLGALAKSTGGIGLRSAIKVVQDILVEGSDGQKPVAEQPLGWLATTVTLYDALEKDLSRAFPSLHQSVSKIKYSFGEKSNHLSVGKTVCILQILGNIPISAQNIASLMHPSVQEASQIDAVNKAIEEIITDPIVPFGEQDGYLCFFSEKLNDIERNRAEIPLRAVELRRIQNEAIKDEVFSTLPSTHLNKTFTVTSGIKVQAPGGLATSLNGEGNPIQTIIEVVEPGEYETTKTRILDDSRQHNHRHNIFLLGRSLPEMSDLLENIYRCREIAKDHRNDPDQEVKEYCKGQTDRAKRLLVDLARLIKQSFLKGSFIFKGNMTAVESLSSDCLDSAKKHLAIVAEQVFDKYSEAPERAKTDLAEKFLRAGSLTAVTSDLDPLRFITTKNKQPTIDTNNKAMVSVRDLLEREGSMEGKRLSDRFTGAPYGWSKDTLRYIIAAMLWAGEIKLKVNRNEITVNGQTAIDALKTNNSFKNVGISLRDERPSNEILSLASERLTELTGETIVPLEDEISKAATKYFPELQHAYGPLAEKLKNLGVPGSDKLNSITQSIRDILGTDGSDVAQRLGVEESSLFESLKWASELKTALEHGLEETLLNLRQCIRHLEQLPSGGLPGKVKEDSAEDLSQVRERLAMEDFFKNQREFASAITNFQSELNTLSKALKEDQHRQISRGKKDLQLVPEWNELTHEEQNNMLGELEDLQGAHDKNQEETVVTYINKGFEISDKISHVKENVVRYGQERVKKKLHEEQEQQDKGSGPKKIIRKLASKPKISSIKDLDQLIVELQRYRTELQHASEFELTLDFINESDS